MVRARLRGAESVAEMFSARERTLGVQVFFTGSAITEAITEARLSEIPLEPVKTLDMESEMEDRSAGETLASTARRVTAPEIEAAGFSEIEAKRPATLSILSVMDGARFSDAPLNPVMILVALSERTNAKSSDMVRAPVKTLAVMSETEGVSVSPLNPVKSLPTMSESVGASDRNFPADLLMLSVMPARLSDMLLNPVKTLATVSETVGVSDRARNPVKTLARASEIVGDSASALNPVKTLE